MPNWCGNKLIIDVSKCEKGNEFEEKLVWLKIQTEQPDGLFEYMCPPEDYPDEGGGYGFSDLYGTKWDIDVPDLSSFDEELKEFCSYETAIYKDEGGRYVLVFRTAWGPPCGFFDKLMERNEGMTGMLLYCEQGLQGNVGAYNCDIEYHYDIGEFCEDLGIKTNSEDDEDDSFWEDEYLDKALEALGEQVGESYCYVDYGG